MPNDSRNPAVNALLFLQIAVSAFFIIIGLQGVLPLVPDEYNFLRQIFHGMGQMGDILVIIISIVELLAGVIMFAGLFFSVKMSMLFVACLFVFIFWSVRIAYIYVFGGIFLPNALVWLQRLTMDAVVLISVWVIGQKYR